MIKLLPQKMRFLIAAATLVIAAFSAFGQESQPWSQNTSPLGAPNGFVNDYAGVIDAATKQQLETKLKNLKDTTSPQVEIAVAVVKTTGERPIFDYSLAVARGWGIGSKEDDSPSALLFIAIEDRKYFTQVSRDLEDELPDGVVGSLQRQYLVPEFKKGNYGKGISDTIDSYIYTIRNKGNPVVASNRNVNAPRQPESRGSDAFGSIGAIFCCALIILVIVLLLINRSGKGGGPSKGDKDRWGGGSSGGSGGSGVSPWVIGGLLGSGGGGGGGFGGFSGGGGGGFGGFGGGGGFSGGGAGGSW